MAEVLPNLSYDGEQWTSSNLNGISLDDNVESSQALMFERTRIRVLAGEREHVQKKTFTKWINSHLNRAGARISDLYIDLRDGRQLIRLLNILSGEKLQRPTRGKMRIHSLENVDKALLFLSEQHVHLENIGAHDIVDGNPSLTLGLVWTIILRFQIQDITIEEIESSETRSAKDALLLWCQIKTADYNNVNVKNFTTSWRDGLAFNALIHKHRPDLINYRNLQKEQIEFNLQNAFDVAEKKLGIYRLLDTEDVAVEFPDEKSIITYVVTLYHYFSKARADTVQGRRIAKVVGLASENERMAFDYEMNASSLMKWIQETITKLSNRDFPNNLLEVQQRLFAFNNYRIKEKPKWLNEKGKLEVQLYLLQCRLRMNNQLTYTPKTGLNTNDLEQAWFKLESNEHDLEICLNEEVLRQQRLEQLAEKFGKKAAMREKWLNDSQRLVACDKFGRDLSSVEAAFKKQEAIQTDIGAFEERLQNLSSLADELKTENYHGSANIIARKESILFLWQYLLELVHSRRCRLEVAYNSQKILAEIDFLLNWIDEIMFAVNREDICKNLVQVDDLLQCHDLLKADIAVVGERVERVLDEANPFYTDEDFTLSKGNTDSQQTKQHISWDKNLITVSQNQEQQEEHIKHMRGRIDLLKLRYQCLVETSLRRDGRLNKGLAARHLLEDIINENEWIKTKIKELRDDDDLLQADWLGSQALSNRYEAIKSEIITKQPKIDEIEKRCNLMHNNEIYQESIKTEFNNVREKWEELYLASEERSNALRKAQNLHLLQAKTDESNAWMLEMLRLVSSDDVGRDEHTAQNLLRKHGEVQNMLYAHREQIDQLYMEAEQIITDDDKNRTEVEQRVTSLQRRFNELLSISSLRQRKLEEAIHLFRLFHDVDNVEAWITEKQRFLYSLDPAAASDIEELEVMKHRFDGFERELYASASKVAVVNNLARQLVSDDHPGSQQILDRLNNLNQKWADLRKLVDSKRDELQSTFGVQTFHIECDETISWIQDKVKIVQSTEDLGRDLSGVIIMQRRLSGLERDLNAIQAKLDQLDMEAERLEQSHPLEAIAVHKKINQINAVWYELKDTLKRREESMGEAAVLQRFLRDLDHFSQWLTRTQTLVASEDIPDSLQSAEQILNRHQSIKEEIDRYSPDYAQMRDYGQRVIRDADSSDPQYVFLRERLNALDDGWNELDQMWHQKQNMLSEAMHLQMYERDAVQAELLLKNQEYYLQCPLAPKSLDEAEQMMKKHDDFTTSLNASEEKIQQLWQFAQRLVHESHYAADRIIDKAKGIVDRFSTNKANASNIGEQLKENIRFYQFVQDCDDLKEWLDAKTAQAQDDTYRETRNIHSKYLRHQAFSAEIAANRERLQNLRQSGYVLAEEQPNIVDAVDAKLAELDIMWETLEQTTKAKGERLFDANRDTLYQQCISDVDRFVTNIEQHLTAEELPLHTIDREVLYSANVSALEADVAGDLTRTNIALTKQTLLENEFIIKQQQVEELKEQAERLKSIEPERSESIEAQRLNVEERFNAIKIPLEAKKLKLAQQKRVHQLLRDIDDEKMWIEDQLLKPLETADSLLVVRRLERKNEALKMEINNRLKSIDLLKEEAYQLSIELPNRTEDFKQKLDELDKWWEQLIMEIDNRADALSRSMNLHKFLVDVEEAESWISEHELQAMIYEVGRDETATRAFIRKHKQVEADVNHFADHIESMKRRLLQKDDDFYLSDDSRAQYAINRLSQLYESLLDLCKDRSYLLDSALQLHLVRREVDDLRQWISERESICNSNELGIDFEHVTLLRQRFNNFADDTTSRGAERVAYVNRLCNDLILADHDQKDLVAQWQNRVAVECWQDLIEMLQTRAAVLDYSWQLQKYFYECKEALSLISERQNSLSDQLGRDAKTVFALQRKHAIFEQDLISVKALVTSISEQCCHLSDLYAGDRAKEIIQCHDNVKTAWTNLNIILQKRNVELFNCADMHRFFNLARDLTIWMEGILRQMKNSGLPVARDVSGVDLLINNHQGLKAEIGARDENVTICINMGKDLLVKKHPRSMDIKDRCIQLCLLRDRQTNEWEDRWEHLQLELEVYQFARDAAVAEAWLISQESYLQIDELGDNLDQVENLIRKHEALEKSIVAQEDRFNALKQLTNLEKREQLPPRPAHIDRRSEYEYEFRTWDEVEMHSSSFTSKGKSQYHYDSAADGISGRNNDYDNNDDGKHLAVSLDMGGRSDGADSGKKTSDISSSGNVEAHPAISALSGAMLDAGIASHLVFSGVSTEIPKRHSVTVIREGYLVKKHIWENFNQKASNRSWERYFFILYKTNIDGCILEMYKDHKHSTRKKKQVEELWTLDDCQIEPAADYHKRSNVFRLTMNNGASYMFMARDFNDMHDWIEVIRSNCGCISSIVDEPSFKTLSTDAHIIPGSKPDEIHPTDDGKLIVAATSDSNISQDQPQNTRSRSLPLAAGIQQQHQEEVTNQKAGDLGAARQRFRSRDPSSSSRKEKKSGFFSIRKKKVDPDS